MRRREFGQLLGIAAGAGMLPRMARAAGYPAQPVSVIVPYAPGGMTDMVARLVAIDLSKALHQTFVVENRSGAAGLLGTEYAAHRPGDGYTLLVNPPGHVIRPAMESVNYDPVRNFVPVALMAHAPNILVAHKSIPATTVPELIAWLKTQDGVPYPSSGIGGASHLVTALFGKLAGVSLTHVPYRGAAPGSSSLIAGQTKLGFLDSASAAPLLASDSVRLIAVSTKERSSLFPDLPTLHESGFPGFDLATWIALFAPAGTPPEIVSLLNREANRIVRTPESMELLRKTNSEIDGVMNPQQCAIYMEEETRKWAEVVRISGAREG